MYENEDSAIVMKTNTNSNAIYQMAATVEFYLYPTVGTVLIHSVKPELTE